MVQNLKGHEIFISWWPEANGEGRLLGPHQKVFFRGNLFEAVYANPKMRSAMEQDTSSGRVAVAACGAVEEPGKYAAIDSQAYPGFQEHGCIAWEFESSSSVWLESE